MSRAQWITFALTSQAISSLVCLTFGALFLANVVALPEWFGIFDAAAGVVGVIGFFRLRRFLGVR